MGERLWQSYAGKVAAMTGDLRGLADHLSRFQAAPRDDTSDCEVCEAGLTARFMLALGREDEAVDIAVELLKQGKYCGEEPWTLLAILTEDALNRRDLDVAERYATAMLIQPVKRPADLRRAGTLLRMEAAFGAERMGSNCWQGAFPGRRTSGDQRLRFYFYLGAADFCQAYSAQHAKLKLPPVPGFTDRPENGLYDCAALARLVLGPGGGDEGAGLTAATGLPQLWEAAAGGTKGLRGQVWSPFSPDGNEKSDWTGVESFYGSIR